MISEKNDLSNMGNQSDITQRSSLAYLSGSDRARRI